jgi:hypothetical protein
MPIFYSCSEWRARRGNLHASNKRGRWGKEKMRMRGGKTRVALFHSFLPGLYCSEDRRERVGEGGHNGYILRDHEMQRAKSSLSALFPAAAALSSEYLSICSELGLSAHIMEQQQQEK